MKNKQSIDSSDCEHVVRPICRHEAGHYVAAKILGFKTGSMTITITNLSSGGHIATSECLTFCALSDKDQIIEYLEKRVIVLYSGALAESLNKGNLDDDRATNIFHGKSQDKEKVHELIHLIRNIKFPNTTEEKIIQSELTVIWYELWFRASEIIQNESELIEAIGQHLASEIKYTNETLSLSKADIEDMPEFKERFRINSSDSI